MTNTRAGRNKGRKERIPVGVPRQKLATDYPIPADKVGRWVNDKPGRVQAFLDGWYDFAHSPDAKVGQGAENERDKNTTRISRIVGTARDGTPMRSYLMLLDRDIYEQDQKTKQEKIDSQENRIKQGDPETGDHGSDGMYTPKDGISFDTNSTPRSK